MGPLFLFFHRNNAVRNPIKANVAETPSTVNFVFLGRLRTCAGLGNVNDFIPNILIHFSNKFLLKYQRLKLESYAVMLQ